MTELWDGFLQALQLIVSFDREVMEIAGRSLWIAATSCTIAMLICLPLGCLIHFRSFPGKRLLISVIQTLYSIPTVLIGLLVFLFISNAGPLGGLGLLFSPAAIIIGQVILISPIMLGLIISALSAVDKMVTETALSLGATRVQAAIVSVREVRYAIVTALIMGFGRAISEIGIALIVGGNIAGYSRTITTAISLETQRGNLELAIALGIILVFIALVINIGLHWLQRK